MTEESRTYSLGGRTFIEVPPDQRTIAHDLYVTLHARECGLTEIPGLLVPGAEVEAVAWSILGRLYASEKLFAMLAGFLVEEGQRWSQKTAPAVAEHFAGLTAEADKDLIREAIVRLTLAFFFSGAKSSPTSRSSFVEMIQAAARKSEAPSISETSPQ